MTHAGPRSPGVLLGAQALLWLTCLCAGMVGVFTASERYACLDGDRAFGCTRGGSLLGLLLAVAAVLILIAVTLTARVTRFGRRRALVLTAAGTAGGLACLVVATTILETT